MDPSGGRVRPGPRLRPLSGNTEQQGAGTEGVRNRRVLLVAPHPFFTERGTPIAVREAASILASSGRQVTILTYHLGEDPGIPGVEVRRIRVPFVRRVGISLTPAKLFCDIFLTAALFRRVAAERFAVIHAVEEAVFPAWLAGVFATPKVVYDMDSSMADQIVEKWPRASWVGGVLRRIETFVMRRVSLILPVCPALGEICRERAPAVPCTVLHDVPPDPEEEPGYDPGIRALAGPGSVVALYVGNFEGYQGVDLLLDAAAALPASSPVKIILVGGGSTGEARVRERLAAEGLSERVFLAGTRPLRYLPQVLAEADILLSPRIKGVNTPMKLYAYLASGRPVVATAILSHTQILGGEDAVLVEAEPAALAGGIEALARDPGFREKVGRAGAALFRQNFTREALRRRIEEAYDAL